MQLISQYSLFNGDLIKISNSSLLFWCELLARHSTCDMLHDTKTSKWEASDIICFSSLQYQHRYSTWHNTHHSLHKAFSVVLQTAAPRLVLLGLFGDLGFLPRLISNTIYDSHFCGNLLASPTLDVHPLYPWYYGSRDTRPTCYRCWWVVVVVMVTV